MSIINKMLKDIEERESSAKAKRPAYVYSGKSAGSRSWVWLVAGVLLVALVIAAWWGLTRYTDLLGARVQSLPEAEQMVISRPATVREEPEVTEPVPVEMVPTAPVTRPARAGQLAQPVVADVAEESADESQYNRLQAITVVANEADDEPLETEEPLGEMTVERSSQEQSAGTLYRRGLAAVEANNVREATQRFQEALLLAPDHHDARLQLAALTFGRGFPFEALTILQEGLQRQPNHHPFILLQARIYERLDQPEQAMDLLSALTLQLPADADLILMQANLATDLGDWSLAVNSYQRLVEWRADQGNWWIAYGFALTQLGATQRAQQADYFRRAADAYQRALNDNRLSPAAQDFALQQREALGY